MTHIPKKAIKKWVEELRSGKWKQTKGRLQLCGIFVCGIFGHQYVSQFSSPGTSRQRCSKCGKATVEYFSISSGREITRSEWLDRLEETYLK